MIINLFFVALFFIPLVVKGAALWSLTEIEKPIVGSINEKAEQAVAENRTPLVSIRVACADPKEGAITVSLPERVIEVRDVRLVIPGAERRIECHTLPMWELLLGFGSAYGYWMVGLQSG